MPRPIALGDLPEEVAFANWKKYQSERTTSFIRLWDNILYDAKTMPATGQDVALSILVRGLVVAGKNHGKLSVRAWLGCVSAKVRARVLIKWWLDNGLLISQSTQIGSKKERGETVAASPPLEASVSTTKPAVRGPRKPALGPAPTSGAGESNWIAPVLAAWKAHHGGEAPPRVRGLLLRGLGPLRRDGQTPAQMAARFEVWLAVRDPAKHQYVEDFTSCYADFDPAPFDDPYHAMRLQDQYGPPTHARPTHA